MRRVERFVPSPAMVVACLALLVALSGVGYAATLPRNTVGAPQLKRNAVTSVKVKDRSLLARDFRRGQLPRGERGLQGLQGPKGDTGAQGAAGSARAFAWVKPTGPSFEGTNVKNFVSVTRPSDGIYCLTPAAGISSTGTAPVVSKEIGYSVNEMHFVVVRGRPFGSCPATDFEVYTYTTNGTLTNGASFTIIVP